MFLVLAIKLLTTKLIARRCAVLFYRGKTKEAMRRVCTWLESITYKEGHQRIQILVDLRILPLFKFHRSHSPFLNVGRLPDEFLLESLRNTTCLSSSTTTTYLEPLLFVSLSIYPYLGAYLNPNYHLHSALKSTIRWTQKCKSGTPQLQAPVPNSVETFLILPTPPNVKSAMYVAPLSIF